VTHHYFVYLQIFILLDMCDSSFSVLTFADICELLREKTESRQ
jgi:hypothetical protein